MKKLNCCQEFEVEYESGTHQRQSYSVLRIREFLSLFTRKRSVDRRGIKCHKRMDKGTQHVYEA